MEDSLEGSSRGRGKGEVVPWGMHQSRVVGRQEMVLVQYVQGLELCRRW